MGARGGGEGGGGGGGGDGDGGGGGAWGGGGGGAEGGRGGNKVQEVRDEGGEGEEEDAATVGMGTWPRERAQAQEEADAEAGAEAVGDFAGYDAARESIDVLSLAEAVGLAGGVVDQVWAAQTAPPHRSPHRHLATPPPSLLFHLELNTSPPDVHLGRLLSSPPTHQVEALLGARFETSHDVIHALLRGVIKTKRGVEGLTNYNDVLALRHHPHHHTIPTTTPSPSSPRTPNQAHTHRPNRVFFAPPVSHDTNSLRPPLTTNTYSVLC